MSKTPRSVFAGGAALMLLLAAIGSPALAEKVILKNGIVYRGSVDHDNTIYWVFDGLRRVVVRDSKIAKFEADSTFGHWETFKLVQPLIQHAGVMPREAIVLETTPWNDKGRRSFSYVGSRSNKPITMEQAIYELGPFLVRIRGVDGFWQDGRLSTSQVPREVVLSLLARVDRKNQNERRRVASFLIQAEWYAEAEREIASLIRDFPDDQALRESLSNARTVVAQLAAAQIKPEIEVRRKAQQHREVMSRLKTFPTKDVASDLLVEVRDMIRKEEAQEVSDKGLADDLRSLSERLQAGARKAWKKPLLEVLQALTEAPDAVRERLVAWRKAEAESSGGDESRFALAMSGYVVGSEAAVTSLETASTYWKARDLLRDYLAAADAALRAQALETLEALGLPADPAQTDSTRRLDLLTRLSLRMPPPLHQDASAPETPRIHRVQDDENAEPTEYGVLLPPEYHPLRTYPAVVALHSQHGDPQTAIDWWAAEASRRGYIVIAPEYNLSDQPKGYHYSASENAAVELSLRDARRRYAIDSDRVYLGGQLDGANMAWDFGLAHPDLFAGVVVISGLPFKYVYRYLPHVEKLPLYVALGDLAPASSEIVFGEVLKPLIAKAYDVTYVEYFHRGLEDLPEEAPAVFDWMDRKHRDPYPKSFEVVSAREADERFYGVVAREFLPGRTTAPEAADPFGKNLNPASIKMKSSSLSNLVNLHTSGVNTRRLEVWVSPRMFDFKKKIEVRVNGKSLFKALARPTIEPFLEDLRIRGDRQQVYWFKVSAS